MFYSALASVDLMLWRALESYGCDSGELFRKAGLDPAKLRQSGARYPIAAANRLWKLARESSADPCLGLKAAAFWHPTALHALGYAWLASDSLIEALTRLVRYYRIVTDTDRLELHESAREATLRLHTVDADLRGIDEIYDGFFATLVRMCRNSCSDRFKPQSIAMIRPRPALPAAFEDFFRAPIAYSAGEDRIVFERSRLREPLPTANVEVAHASDQIITNYLAHLDRSAVSMRVRARLIDELPSGRVSQASIARTLNMSLRSLQRRLAEEGTTYKQLLDETRRELAEQYVRQSRLSLGEITFLLGFSEPGNFTRAFKRWTGKPPSEFRVCA